MGHAIGNRLGTLRRSQGALRCSVDGPHVKSNTRRGKEVRVEGQPRPEDREPVFEEGTSSPDAAHELCREDLRCTCVSEVQDALKACDEFDVMWLGFGIGSM